MPEITIRLRPNGPLLIESSGPLDQTVKIIDHQGNAFALPANKPAISLCRCGQSSNKPFCDGTHKTCGFMAVELAQPPAPPPTT